MKSRFLLFSALALCSATVAAGNYPTSLYVIGDATPAQWDSNNVIRMVTVEDGVYEYTGDLTEGRMRFVTTYDFAPGYGPAMASTVVGDNDNETYLDLTTGSHELEYRSDYTAPDKSFKVSAAGRYKFRVDLTGEKPVVEVIDGTGLPDQAAAHFEAVYAIGDATDVHWAIESAIELPETSFDSGIYKGTLQLSKCEAFEGLKFMMTRKWNDRMYVSAQPEQTIAAPGEYDLKYTTTSSEDWKFGVLVEGLYEVTVDVNTMKLTIAETYPEKLWVIGDAVGGWTFEDNHILEMKDQEGVYSWTGDLTEGELKFYDGNSFDYTAYGAEAANTPFQEGESTITKLSDGNDFKFYVEAAQAGNYTLTVDLKSMKLNVEKNEGPSTAVEEIESIDWVQESYGIVCDRAQSMALYDISGRKVVSVDATLLPFDGLNSGIYILVIETSKGRMTHKIAVR